MCNLVGTDTKIADMFYMQAESAVRSHTPWRKNKETKEPLRRKFAPPRQGSHIGTSDTDRLKSSDLPGKHSEDKFLRLSDNAPIQNGDPGMPEKRGTVKLIVKSSRKSKDGMKQEIRLINPGGKLN